MRIQSTHDFGARGLDAYWTCREAIESLLILEGERIPYSIWEPACGTGAIVYPLRASGRFVVASDIVDYRVVPGAGTFDYLITPPPRQVEAVVTNPPFRMAEKFARKAINECGYVCLLLRANFLVDGAKRGHWLDGCEPTRVWWSVQRLPFMHRHGWTGPKSTTNTSHCWAVWERGAPREFPRRFYWRELLGSRSEHRVAA